MRDLQSTDSFYHTLCDDLQRRLERSEGQRDRALEEARRSQTAARLLREIHRIAGADVPMAQIRQQFLGIVQSALDADRVAILRHLPADNRFVAESSVGFPESGQPAFRPPPSLGAFHFADADTGPAPAIDCLRQVVGTPCLLWAHDARAGLALLVGIAGENTCHEADREIVDGALIALVGIEEHGRIEEALRTKARQQEQLLASAGYLNSSLDFKEVLTRIGIAAKEILQASGCVIYLLEPDGSTLTPVVSLEPPFDDEILAQPLDIETSWTGQAVKAKRTLVFNDVSAGPYGQHIPGTPEEEDEHLIAAPLMYGSRVLGALCLLREGMFDFSDEDQVLAEAFATYATSAFRNAQAHHDLQREMEERRRADEAITASLQEKEVLLKEIHHRVKNNLQIVSSLLYLQSKTLADPEIQGLLLDGQNRVRTMALVHERLYRSGDLARVDFAAYVRSLVTDLVQSYRVQVQTIRLLVDVGDVYLDIDAAVPCGLIINELVSNALKHAFPAGRAGEVRVTMHHDSDGRLILTVSDDGIGFPKSVNFRSTSSLGLQLVHTLARQLAGSVEMDGGEGTTVRITFAGRWPPSGGREDASGKHTGS